MTTTTTTTTEERMLTRCGITAPAQLWKDLRYSVYSNTDDISPGSGTPEDAELYMARNVTGFDDWRALACLYQRRQEQSEERTRSTSMSRLAEAAQKLGDDLVHAARIMRQQATIANR